MTIIKLGKLKCLMGILFFYSSMSYSAFAPYNDLTLYAGSGQPQDLVVISGQSGIKNFRLAFINDTAKGACTPAWGGQPDKRVAALWGQALLQRMSSLGLKYTISMGGANGIDLSGSCSTVAALTQAYQNIIMIYNGAGLLGLDFDIENDSENRTNLLAALLNIQAQYPNLVLSFTIKVTPTGLLAKDQTFITQANAAGLKFLVNIMAMDFYGTCAPMQVEQCAEQASNATYSFLSGVFGQTGAAVWNRMGVTIMIGLNDDLNSFSLPNAAQFNTFAKNNGLNLVSMWSVARDHSCNESGAASAVCSGASVNGQPFQTQDWQFSQAFSK